MRRYLDPNARAPGIVGLTTGMTNESFHARTPFPMHCEHCDGEHGSHVRFDELRGWICKHCDSALDEMFKSVEADERRELAAEKLREREGTTP